VTEPTTLASRRGRLILLACVLSSGAVFLDGTVVTIALSQIGEDLGADFSTLQWTVNAYLLTLSALVLVGGSLGDLLGRRRVFMTGIVAFGLASALCGLAQSGEQLVAARALQGVAGALVSPGSLSIVNAVFPREERGKAIGMLTGFTSVAIAGGPFIGGWLVDLGPNGWRWVFLVNLPVTLAAVLIARTAIPDLPATRRAETSLVRQLDLVGAALASSGLTLLIWPLIEWDDLQRVSAAGMLTTAVVVLAAFVVHEHRTPYPMMPLALWRYRSFAVGNVVACLVYAVLGVMPFLLILTLQRSFGYSAFEAGLANLPPTLLLLVFAPFTGKLLARFGARTVISLGCLFGAAGVLLLTLADPARSFWTGILPGMLVWGVGLVLLIAPVSTVTLSGLPPERSGIAAGVSAAFGRVAGVVSVAALPLAAGFSGTADAASAELVDAFGRGMYLCAVVLVIGAVVAATLLPKGATTLARFDRTARPDIAREPEATR
jgi:EmrB/QacA subfamily drug resistance transporter